MAQLTAGLDKLMEMESRYALYSNQISQLSESIKEYNNNFNNMCFTGPMSAEMADALNRECFKLDEVARQLAQASEFLGNTARKYDVGESGNDLSSAF